MPRLIFSHIYAEKQRQLRIIFTCARHVLDGPDIIQVSPGRRLYVETHRPSNVRGIVIPTRNQGTFELLEQNPTKDSDYAKLARTGAKLIWVILNGQYTGQGLFAEPDTKLGWYDRIHDICQYWIQRFKTGEVMTHRTDDPWLCDICGNHITTWELKDMYPRCQGCRIAIAQEAKGTGYDRVLEVLDEATKC